MTLIKHIFNRTRQQDLDRLAELQIAQVKAAELPCKEHSLLWVGIQEAIDTVLDCIQARDGYGAWLETRADGGGQRYVKH